MTPEHTALVARLGNLREHPYVIAWIADYKQTINHQYPDCHRCGFPHAPVLLCAGATFGRLQFGGSTYYVSGRDVRFWIEKRSKPMDGHHWRNDITFKRTATHVLVTSWHPYNNTPQHTVLAIPLNEWQTIVEQMERKP